MSTREYHPLRVARPGEAPRQPTRPATILVVVRDNLLRDLVAAILGRLGYVVVAAASAEQALSAVRERPERPQLLLLDLLLPQLNGLMLLAALRQLPGMDKVPAIVLSSLGFPEIVAGARAAGARDFILKPFDPPLLASKVQSLLAHVNA